jgi:cobalamin biosynthesis protein CobT
MGTLKEEISELVDDYMPAKIVKLPEEEELIDEEETPEVDETETETTEEEPEEPSEVVDEQEGEEEEESDEVDEAEEVEADEEEETSEVENRGESNPLYAELNALATGEINLEDEEINNKPEQPTESVQPAQPEKPAEHAGQEFDVLKGIDFDDVVSKPEVFRQVIDRVGEQLHETISAKISQAVTQIVGYQVQQQMSLQNLTNKFWEANQDLEPVRPYVAKIASTIQSQRPDLPLQKIFEKTAEVARKKLGLTKTQGGGGSPEKRRRSKPALVKSGGRVRSTKTVPKRSGQQQQIADLIY